MVGAGDPGWLPGDPDHPSSGSLPSSPGGTRGPDTETFLGDVPLALLNIYDSLSVMSNREEPVDVSLLSCVPHHKNIFVSLPAVLSVTHCSPPVSFNTITISPIKSRASHNCIIIHSNSDSHTVQSTFNVTSLTQRRFRFDVVTVH